MGVFSYIKIPKEAFPDVTLDMALVKGSYTGASAESLNDFAVIEIENKIKAISGIKRIKSIVKNGNFFIEAELQNGTNKDDLKDAIKDAINSVKKDFPKNMEEPIVSIVKVQQPILNASIISGNKSKGELLVLSKKLKSRVLQTPNVSEVEIFGSGNFQIDIYLDEKKINMYGLETSLIVNVLRKFSYIYPVGQIKQTGNHVYLTANNNKFKKDEWENTIIKVNDKKVYLKDIAIVNIGYSLGSSKTISRLNAQNAISFNIYKDNQGDSITIVKKIKDILNDFHKNVKDLDIVISRDHSKIVSNRIRIIIANITLGLILVGLSMYLLISPRLSLVIVMGIPFSFIIGLFIIERAGYSLNLISLMAMLISIGIVVDDAIVVSENIQRRLDEGEESNKAILRGTKEMVAPVLVASFTTIFAFLPMFLISGEIGKLTKLIPIVMSIVIIASLIESFIFLPLHTKHILKREDRVLDWSKAYDLYETILHKIIYRKKTFLIIFFITIPVLTLLLIKQSRFQIVPNMDSRNVTLSFKLNKSTPLKKTDETAKKYEQLLLKNREKLYIENITTVVGVFKSITGTHEAIENGFILKLQLQKYRDDNFLQNYINPILDFSFDFQRKDEKRLTSTNQTKENIRKLISPEVKQDNFVEFNIISSRIGLTETDIELKLSDEDKTLLLSGIKKLKNSLSKIDGVKDVTDNTKLGETQYKYSLNNYAMSLGLSDSEIASQLSSYFTKKNIATTFNNDGVVDIVMQSIYKDKLDALKHFLIDIDNKKIELQELVNFKIERNFEKIKKENGQIQNNVYANINKDITSSSEVLKKIEKTIQEIKNDGTKLNFGGEREKNKQMRQDLIKAFLIGIFLIFITLLLNFQSFKSVFIILSVIPFTAVGSLIGHFIMGINVSSQSVIGMLGLAGVVINDGIIMLDFLHDTKKRDEFFKRAKQRVRPILITSITTVLGLSTLIFFPTSQSIILQPMAVSLGFGIAWGTVLNLLYVPALYAVIYKINDSADNNLN